MQRMSYSASRGAMSKMATSSASQGLWCVSSMGAVARLIARSSAACWRGMAASRSRQSIWRLGRSGRASPGLIGVFRRFKQDCVTADYVFCSNLPYMLRVEQRRSPSTHRKKSTLTLFTPITVVFESPRNAGFLLL